MGLLSACASLVSIPRYTHAPDSAVRRELEKRRRANDSRLLRVVEGYMGVPYRWGGTTRGGMDCSAFARAVYRETYGIELPRTSRQMFGLGRTVESRASLRRGDLVFFRDTQAGAGVSHVGVYVGDGMFAHASPPTGGTLTALDAPYYRARYAGARRLRN
ncbi:MAG: NlpC/P60 family protein [Candidatus Latescibacterota bacterium]